MSYDSKYEYPNKGELGNFMDKKRLNTKQRFFRLFFWIKI